MDDLITYPNSPPIAQLPVEMLLHIFALLIHKRTPSPPDDTSLILSHVCRHWRAVAIGFDALWTTISTSNKPEWTTLSLERSRSAPLDVFILHHQNTDLQERYHRVSWDVSRFESLNLAIRSWPDETDAFLRAQHDMLTRLAACPAPLLRRLTISSSPDVEPLSTSLFAGATPPNLRHLVLVLCAVPPGWHVFSAPLVHLELNQCTFVHGDTREHLLNALSKLPTLETFVVDGISRFTEFVSGDINKVYLPNLTHLKICSTIDITATMLRCLSFPPNVHIELRVGDDEFTLPFVEYMQLVISMLVFSLFSHFTSVISGGNGICTCAIDIDGRAGKENEPSFTSPASHTTPEALDASPTTLPSPTFHLTFCGQRENGLQHCIYLLKTLAFLPGIIYAPILIVWPHPLLMTQPAHWRDGLSEFSHLRIIKILGQAVYGFVGALDGQNSDAPPLFPNLGEVDIEDVDLTTTYAAQAQRSNPPGMGPPEGTGSHMPVVDRLAAAVKWRAALGCPPIVFTIRRCNVTQGQIDGLMGAVEPGLSVVWDREVEGLTEKQLTN